MEKSGDGRTKLNTSGRKSQRFQQKSKQKHQPLIVTKAVSAGSQIKQMRAICPRACEVLRALSHPYRLMILVHLLSGQKTVTELVKICEGSQSQISQYLNRMKAEGLVVSSRDGKMQYYRLADARIEKLVSTIQQTFCGAFNP
jgi:ArsR family transcriptional regulator